MNDETPKKLQTVREIAEERAKKLSEAAKIANEKSVGGNFYGSPQQQGDNAELIKKSLVEFYGSEGQIPAKFNSYKGSTASNQALSSVANMLQEDAGKMPDIVTTELTIGGVSLSLDNSVCFLLMHW